MESERIAELVHQRIADYRCEIPVRTVGNAFSLDRIRRDIERLKKALVQPYAQRFELRETAQQIGLSPPEYADYWVIAEVGDNWLEWFDPRTGDFGLGRREGSGIAISIGVRGDAIGVFIAM